LSEEERRKVRRRWRDHHGDKRRYDDVDIVISFGRMLPDDWVYYTVPTFIVDVAPWARGYQYVYVRDRYVLVEPDTHEVVAYVDADTGEIVATARRTAGGRAVECRDVQLTAAQEQLILRSVDPRGRVNIGGIGLGISLPQGVNLLELPDDLERELGIGECRYVALPGQRVALVAPSDRQVVYLLNE
jgi:hypothetical protein